MRKQDESPNFHFVSKLTRQNINELSLLLSEENVWRSVDYELEYCIEKIEQIQSHQMHPNIYSCATTLFRIIGQDMPEYLVNCFKPEYLQSIGEREMNFDFHYLTHSLFCIKC